MKRKWIVIRRKVIVEDVYIEAENKKEALELVARGDGQVYSDDFDQDFEDPYDREVIPFGKWGE